MAKNDGWYKLDHAAKLIPSTMSGPDTRVFRLCCDLKDPIDPELLQRAVDETSPSFPHFNCVLRKGLFWYYLEHSDRRAIVYEDDMPPLSPIYIAGRKNLLYRVNYFGRRVNLEMFHVLADGTGGFFFLQNIIARYLILRYGLALEEAELANLQASEETGSDDAFRNFFRERDPNKEKGENLLKNMAPGAAYQLRGAKDPDLVLRLTEGTASLEQALAIAHERDVTLGVLVTAIFVQAILKRMPEKERAKPIAVSVPVNLRQYFPSETTRNFFSVIGIRYDPALYDGTLESILPAIRDGFAEQLTEEKLEMLMRPYSALETNWASRLVPLPLKDSGLKGVTFLRNRGVTTNVSNVSRVQMPDTLTPYIEKFSCFMSTRNAQLCFCSFEDHLVFGVTSAFTRTDIEQHFFRGLVELGLSIELETSSCNAGVEKLPLRSAAAVRRRRTDAAM